MPLSDFPLPPFNFFYDVTHKECLNSYCGSYKGFNYKVYPVEGSKELETPPTLSAFVWYGEKCSDLSEKAAETTAPMEEEGLALLLKWIVEQYAVFAEK